MKINAYVKSLQNNVIYEDAPQLENSTSNITEGEFYHEISEKNRQEHDNPEHNGIPSKQRVFCDEIPDEQEISASSNIDDAMNVITKGVGTAICPSKYIHFRSLLLDKYNNRATVIGQGYEITT